MIIGFGPIRTIVVTVRTVFAVCVSALFVYVGIVGFGKVVRHPSAQLAVNEFVLVPMVLSIFLSQAAYTLRFWRSVLTTFRLSQSGLMVRNAWEGTVMVYWSDLTHASYTRLGRLIRLESPKFCVPLAIMADYRESRSPDFDRARGLIREVLSDRWSEGWL